ncbi:RepA leader peptide Tap [Escherichia coli]|nr:RepA leader peptide Tap [Escherichia coli]
MPGKVQDFFLCSLLLRIVSAGCAGPSKNRIANNSAMRGV